MEYFCAGCGTKTENNTRRSDHSGDYNLSCDCGFIMRFYIYKERDKTDEEVEITFQQTELTDSQRGTKRRNSSSNRK